MRASLSLLAAVTIAACNGAPAASPTGPTPQAVEPQSVPARTITGSVWVHSGTTAHPAADIRVGIWLEVPTAAYSSGAVRSDSAGRFSLVAPADALARLYAGTKGLLQPCLATVRVGQTEATVRLVAESEILRARDWPDFAVERVLSGTVFEASPMGRLPSADARIEFDGAEGDGLRLADTRTDTNGRFVVCGVEAAGRTPHALVVFKPGFMIAYTAVPTDGGPPDIALQECPGDRAKLHGGWCH